MIRHGTLERWREDLKRQEYASNTVNGFLSVSNSYLDFAGYREYQLIGQIEVVDNIQPELTRAEYLRLLQTARADFPDQERASHKPNHVSASIRSLCADARVPEEKGNPRCLKRLYQATRGVIENNIALLVEQAMDRLLEREQFTIGWEEQ